MDLSKQLLLSLVKKLEISNVNLVSALEDLNPNELERFISLMTGTKTKTLKAGDVLYSKKLDKEITITSNNFVQDRVEYSYLSIRYVEPENVNREHTSYNTEEFQTDKYSAPVGTVMTGWDKYGNLF